MYLSLDIAMSIPELLIYFVPGFIALFVYRELRSREHKAAYTAIISCCLSYIGVAALRALLLACNATELNFYQEALIVTVGLSACSACCAEIIKSNWANNALKKIFRISTSRDTWDSVIDKRNGTEVLLRLKNTGRSIIGTIASYGDTSKDQWIAIACAKLYEDGEDEPYDTWKYKDERIVVNISDIEFIKFIPRTKNNLREGNHPTLSEDIGGDTSAQ